SLKNARWADHERANVQGTANVFDAAARAGVRRIVHVSSVAVYARHGALAGEDTPQLGADSWRLPFNAYAVSKALSQQCAWRKAAEQGLDLPALRPCAICGAFDPNFTAVFRRLIGLPITVMPAWMSLALVYAGDVAEAAALALEHTAASGRAYNVTGDADR